MEYKTSTNIQKQQTVSHTISIDNRSHMLITGVKEVVSATDGGVYIKLFDGILEISGENLRVEKLSPEEKLLKLSGTINSLKYNSGTPKNIFKKLFK